MLWKKLSPLLFLLIVHNACRSHQSATTQPIVSGPTIYVATNGNDKWNGSAPEPNFLKTNGPVATLERARDLLRKTGGGTVYIRGGTYARSQTFDLGEEDGAGDRPGVDHVLAGIASAVDPGEYEIGMVILHDVPRAHDHAICGRSLDGETPLAADRRTRAGH